jgi:acetyltransferase-like isoleucine patch superfamily enzyme
MSPRGYIDSSAEIYHSELYVGRNVYLAPRVLVFENNDGGPIILEDKVAIYRDVILETGQLGNIKVGTGSSIHPGCQLKAYVEPVEIGDGVMIAGNVALYSYDHGMEPDLPIRRQPLVSKGAIIIGNDAWIGTGSVILSGVTIGDGAIVGAGSTVTKNIPVGGIAVGNPARVIRYRSD